LSKINDDDDDDDDLYGYTHGHRSCKRKTEEEMIEQYS